MASLAPRTTRITLPLLALLVAMLPACRVHEPARSTRPDTDRPAPKSPDAEGDGASRPGEKEDAATASSSAPTALQQASHAEAEMAAVRAAQTAAAARMSAEAARYERARPAGEPLAMRGWQGDPAAAGGFNTEGYAEIRETGFRRTLDEPLSTFSIDVDTASYSNVRRFLDHGTLPPRDAVRVEEMLNTFRYDDPEPSGPEPFSVTTEVASCPWAPDHRLLRVGLRGRSIPAGELPARNLVFLIDVSGSMAAPNKLPLVKQSMDALLGQLTARDRVGIVVYAGAAGLVLEPTPADRTHEIRQAIESLQPGGSTHGAQGIRLAYQLAERAYIEGAANRVVLCTDGDFNVGTTSHGELAVLIEQEREKGVFLTVLGFGTGNVKDSTMELLADRGNGNYAYIDSYDEARKVLVDEADAWLVTIAKDVKIQVEMNPGRVEAWRLVGYENRALAAEDFNDDRKDAGEIGAGHAVVALYEIIPAGGQVPSAAVDPLRYQERPHAVDAGSTTDELGFIKLRYKEPDGDRSLLVQAAIQDDGQEHVQASEDFRFAAAVATFGQALRRSEHAPGANFALAEDLARGALGRDEAGRRSELLGLIARAEHLASREAAPVTH